MSDEAVEVREGAAAKAPNLALIGVLLAVLSSLSYATVNALLRSIAGEVDPFTGALMRQLPLVLTLAVLAIVLRPKSMRPRAPEFIGPKLALALLSVGVVALFIGNSLLFWSFEWVGLGIATAAYLGGLLLGATVISWIFLKERPGAAEFVGMGLVAVGLAVTALSAQNGPAGPGAAIAGFLFAVLTGVCYSISNSVSRVSQRQPGRFIVTLGLTTLGGVTGLLVFIAIRHGGNVAEAFGELTGHQFLVLVLAGCANGVALASITVAVRFTTLTTVSMLNSLVIVFGVIFGLVFFDEPVTWLLALGCAGILLGVVVGQVRWRGRRRPNPMSEGSVGPES